MCPSPRRWIRHLAATATVLLTLVVAVLALLQLPPVATWVVRRLTPLLPLNPGYRLDVGRVSGDWIHGLELEHLLLRRGDRELAQVGRLRVGYDPRLLYGSETRLRELAVVDARVTPRREGGSWDLEEALRRSADTTAARGAALAVDRVELRGVRLVAELSSDSALRVRGLTLVGRGLVLGKQARLTLDHLDAAVAPPGSTRWFSVATRGALTGDELRLEPVRVQTEQTNMVARVVLPRDFGASRRVDRLDVRLRADPLALADLAALVPAVGTEGALRLEANAAGAGRLVTAHVSAQLNEATLTLDGGTRLEEGRPAEYRAHGTIHRLNPARLLRGAPVGEVNAALDAALRGTTPTRARGRLGLRLADSRIAGRAVRRLDLRSDLDNGRADIALRGDIGAAAVDAAGWVRPFDSVPSYRIAGRSRGRALAFRFRLPGTLAPSRGRLEAAPELLIGGGRISALALVRLGDTVSYDVRRGTIDRVDLGSLLGDTLVTPLSGRFTLRGRGIAPRQAAATARLELDGLRYGPTRVDSIAARLQLRDGLARAALRGALAGGRVALNAEARPFDSPLSVAVSGGRLDSLDLSALLGRGLGTSLNARFAASTYGTRLDSLAGRLAVALLPSRVGRAELRDGRLALALRRGVVRGQASFTGPDGELAAKLVGQATDGRTQLGADGSLRLEHLARWSGRPDADGRLEGRFRLHGTADAAGLLSLGGTVTASGAVGELRLDPVHLALTPDPGAVHLDTLIVRSNVALLDGSGRLALRDGVGDGALRIVGRLNDPAPLASLVGVESASLDSGNVALTVAGAPGRRRFDGGVDARGLLLGDMLAGRVTLRASGTLAGPRGPALAGDVRIEDGAYGRTIVRRARVTGRYDSLLVLSGTAALDDSVRVTAALTGSARPDTVRARLERLDIGGWSLERPAALTARPRVEIHHLALHAGDRRVSVDGVLDRHGTSDLTLRLDRVDLDLLRELGLSPVSGRLDGSLHLAGTASAPTIEGDVALTLLQGPRQELGRIHTALAWKGAGLRIDATAEPRQGGRLRVNGTLPLRLALTAADTLDASTTGDSVALAMRADNFDLGFFEPLLPRATARALRGRLALEGRIGGTLLTPRAEGTFALNSVALTLPAIGVSYRQGALAGRLDGDRLSIDRLRFLTGRKQELSGQGTVLLRPLDNPALDLSTELRDFRISNSEQLRTVASGRAHLGGTLLAPVVTGRVRLGRTDFFTGAEAGPAQVEQVELTPADLRLLARQFGPAAIRRAHAAPGILQRVRLAVDLDLPNRVWIRRRTPPTMDIELWGQARLRQDPGGPIQFFGAVQPVLGRNTLQVSGRAFRLTGGNIQLSGPVDSAHLDVTAEYQAPTQSPPDGEGITIEAEAVGSPDSLALTFSSDPSMSQEDILSYIVTGAPTSDNPLAASQVAGGAALGEQFALGQLAPTFTTRLGQGLGFDVFDVQPEITSGLTLTAGRYLTSRWFAELQLPLQGENAALGAPGARVGPSFELDYGLRRWLSAGLRGGSVPPGISFRGQRAY